MLVGTEEIAARAHALAARQVYPAMAATDHVFFGLAGMGRRLGAQAASVTPHEEVNRREYHDDQQYLGQCHPLTMQAIGQTGMSAPADYPTVQE
jgi:hypothetical protein